MGDPGTDVARRRGLLEVAQREHRGAGACGVVLVRERRPEDAVEVGALVAEGQLEDVPAVPREDLLRAAHELVELRGRVLVLVVVDPAEVDEDRERRAELGQELAAPGREPLVDGRKEPGARELVRQRRLVDLDDRVRVREQFLDDAASSSRPRAPTLPASASGRDGVEHHLALLRMSLGDGEPVDQAPGQHLDQLDLGIPDDEAPRLADRDRDLEPELEDRAGGRDDLALALDRLQHPEAGGDGIDPVVAVEPAGDRIAAEVDDVAAEAVELGDHGVEDPVQMPGEHLRGALRAELVRERLGDGREAGDVGEERRARDTRRQRLPGGQRATAVAWNIGPGGIRNDASCGSGDDLLDSRHRGRIEAPPGIG